MKKARFVPAARNEFLAAVNYYNDARFNLGSQFVATVEATIMRALKFPYSGRPSSAETYRMYLKEFPFSLFYRPDLAGILILAVAHNARKPGYWNDRRPA